MDYNTIKALLDKYFAGETSLAEEQQLRAYFQQEHIAEEFRMYQPLFGYFQQEVKQETSAAFNDRWAEAPPQRTAKLHSLRVVYRWAAAAALVLALGVTWYFNSQVEQPGPTATIDWSQYEPKTEEEAIKLTRGAFLRTSAAMYQGLSTAATEMENVKKIMDWD